MDIQEVLRRWEAGDSRRQIAAATGLSRVTVAKYIKLAEKATVGASQARNAELAELLSQRQPRGRKHGPAEDLLSKHEEQLQLWVCRDHLQLTRVHELLQQQLRVKVNYKALYRFVVAKEWLPAHRGTVRLADTKPGEALEVDFGYLGRLLDPVTNRLRKAWAFSMVLVFSRHMFVFITFKQDIAAAIAAFEAAWASFGGVVRRVVLDNFAAAVDKADNYDPVLNRTLAEYSQYRGFILDTARVRHPRDKPHTERSIPFIRGRFYKGGTFRDIVDAQQQATRWCLEVAGQRIHGTTRLQPLAVFEQLEQAALLPWDAEPYDVPLWAQPKVAPDYHIQFARALYSIPYRYRGHRVDVRGDRQLVRAYVNGQLIKEHPRMSAGGRSTDPNDYPPEKVGYALRAPERCIQKGQEQGPAIGQFITKLLAGDFPWARLRQAYKCLRLADKYGAERVNAACELAVAHDLLNVRRLESMLTRGLDQQAAEPSSTTAAAPPPGRFALPGSAFSQLPLVEDRS
ncbi:MAG TPA: IS21 family transposase [Chloroflexota bacterium]|nr:IS21 family transposase [Chloroflexota bacterium]